MPKVIDFRLRYQVGEDSPHAALFRYLRSKQTEFHVRQMVVWALLAFWYPLACKWSGLFSESRLKVIARNAIYELQKQISFLATTFGLEQELTAPMLPAGLNGGTTGTEVAEHPIASANGASEDGTASFSPPLADFDRHPDDDVLDQNFD